MSLSHLAIASMQLLHFSTVNLLLFVRLFLITNQKLSAKTMGKQRKQGKQSRKTNTCTTMKQWQGVARLVVMVSRVGPLAIVPAAVSLVQPCCTFYFYKIDHQNNVHPFLEHASSTLWPLRVSHQRPTPEVDRWYLWRLVPPPSASWAQRSIEEETHWA